MYFMDMLPKTLFVLAELSPKSFNINDRSSHNIKPPDIYWLENRISYNFFV